MQLQNIYVELSNGKTGVFTGPVLVTKKMETDKVTVLNVKFSQPKDVNEKESKAGKATKAKSAGKSTRTPAKNVSKTTKRSKSSATR